mgnify:FL=1
MYQQWCIGSADLARLASRFFRLRQGVGKSEKDQKFPVSHLSQFIIVGSNRLGQSEIKFLSMGSKMGSAGRISMQK